MPPQVIAGFFQIGVAILGALMPLVIEALKRRRAAATAPAGAPAPEARSEQSERAILDLAILLIYAAFLSAILSHSMIVSGRTPSFNTWVLAAVAAISSGISFVVYAAWRKGFGEMAAGVLSVATLLILLIAPGNMTSPSARGAEAGLPLPLPVFALTFATAVALIYLFGNPLSREIAPARRRYVALALIVLACGTALVLGFEFVGSTVNDEKAPKFTGTQNEKSAAEEVLRDIRSLDIGKRGVFYRHGSEIALLQAYSKSYFAVRPEIAEWETTQQNLAAQRQAGQAPPATPEPATPQPGAQTSTDYDPGTVTDTTSTMSAIAPAPALPSQPHQPTPQELEEIRRTTRIRYLAIMSRYVDQLDKNALVIHIQDRLPFIHPSPIPPRLEQVMLPLPGLDADTRRRAIADYRVIRTLKYEPALPWESETFRYSNLIGWYYRFRLDGTQAAKSDPEKANLTDVQNDEKIADVIFPGPGAGFEHPFSLQMALPADDEAYFAYRAAIDLSATDRPPQFSTAHTQFRSLPLDQQRAFIEYAAPAARSTTFTLIKKLADANADLTGFPVADDARLDLSTRLDQSASGACTADLGAAQHACQEIVRALPLQDRSAFAKLAAEPWRNGTNIAPLFSAGVLDFARATDKVRDPRELLDVIADPLSVATQRVIAADTANSDWLPKIFAKFIGLTPDNREQILHHIAIMLYRATGDYSLSPLRLLALQASTLSPVLALLCATMLMFPGSVAAIAFGGFSARKLIERDRTRLLIAAERRSGQVVGDIGLPVDLLGREPLLERIRKLGGRGWNTTAIVGRRGIGKSRALHELYKPANSDSNGAAVSVWIAAPTSYNEAEFVESVFEQLALRTERAVADQLRARPLPVRMLEQKQAKAGVWMFTTILAALALLLGVAYRLLLRPEVMITWIPILFVVAVASGILVRYLSDVQPIDLSPWLERDRSHSASAVLLYREARAALRYLDARRSRGASAPIAPGVSSLSVGVFTGLVAWMVILILTEWWIAILGGIAAGWGVVYVMQRLRMPLPRGEHAGASVMSLTANYRRFAATVVHHVQSGALGSARNVMICIDELDKVIDEGSVRDFLRKMKGIFEVPGVYYYLSLAEDMLARLYLAGAEGKNEIDSSLDHVIRVPPLSWSDSGELVRAYAKKLGFDDVDPRLMHIIAAVSFGVPRDVIRRCDELVSTYGASPSGIASMPDVARVAAAVRADRVDLACEREGWTREVHARLSAPASEAAKSIAALLRTETQERRQRLLALLWTLCACEFACRLRDDRREAILNRLFLFGYDLPIAPISDLIASIDELSSLFDTPIVEEKPVPAPVEHAERPLRTGISAAHELLLRKRKWRGGNGADPVVGP